MKWILVKIACFVPEAERERGSWELGLNVAHTLQLGITFKEANNVTINESMNGQIISQ